MSLLPDNLRSLTVVRLPDGTYEANINTVDMPSNTFRHRHGVTADEALTALLRRPAPAVLPPVPV